MRVIQSQNAVTDYCSSYELLPFGFPVQYNGMVTARRGLVGAKCRLGELQHVLFGTRLVKEQKTVNYGRRLAVSITNC